MKRLTPRQEAKFRELIRQDAFAEYRSAPAHMRSQIAHASSECAVIVADNSLQPVALPGHRLRLVAGEPAQGELACVFPVASKDPARSVAGVWSADGDAVTVTPYNAKAQTFNRSDLRQTFRVQMVERFQREACA